MRSSAILGKPAHGPNGDPAAPVRLVGNEAATLLIEDNGPAVTASL